MARENNIDIMISYVTMYFSEIFLALIYGVLQNKKGKIMDNNYLIIFI